MNRYRNGGDKETKTIHDVYLYELTFIRKDENLSSSQTFPYFLYRRCRKKYVFEIIVKI